MHVQKEERENKPRKVVVIVTFMRSGSTFLGEMFNVHKDTFYMFEPLHPWAATGCSKLTQNERMKFLSKILSCEFENRYNTSIPWNKYEQQNNLSLPDTLNQKGASLHKRALFSISH